MKCKGEVGFIFGRRTSGSFDIRKLDGTKISEGSSYKKLKLIFKRKSYLIERRGAVSSPQLKQGEDLPHKFDDIREIRAELKGLDKYFHNLTLASTVGVGTSVIGVLMGVGAMVYAALIR